MSRHQGRKVISSIFSRSIHSLGGDGGIVGRDQEEGAGARQFFVNPVEIPAPSAGGGGILPQVQDFTGGSQFPGQAGDVFAEPQGNAAAACHV